MKVNIIDVDGTLCPSIFNKNDNNNDNNNDNDNNNCLSPGFLKDLAAVEPYPWAKCASWTGWNIIVTGRMPQHEKLTREWCADKLGLGVDGFVSVKWDDTKATREESYICYVERKIETILEIARAWEHAVRVSGLKSTVNDGKVSITVFEDDKKVLYYLKERAFPHRVVHIEDGVRMS